MPSENQGIFFVFSKSRQSALTAPEKPQIASKTRFLPPQTLRDGRDGRKKRRFGGYGGGEVSRRLLFIFCAPACANSILSYMDEKIKEELDKIVDTLANTGIVSRVFLFGSYARGEETPDSDIDLCVLTPIKDDGRRLTETSIDFRVKLLNVQNSALDLLTYNQDDFLARAARPRSIQREIMEHGVVLYG
jgi:predicted nucleotidyltransferase